MAGWKNLEVKTSGHVPPAFEIGRLELALRPDVESRSTRPRRSIKMRDRGVVVHNE